MRDMYHRNDKGNGLAVSLRLNRTFGAIMTLKIFTSFSVAALTTAFSTLALAQGGDDPISGIDIIARRDPSQEMIKPFSLTGEEIKQINAIKDVGRMELILKAVAKRTKTQEGFVKSGMAVMGKDWCGECAWPEKASYKFKSGETTYTLDLKFHSEGGIRIDEADTVFSKRSVATPAGNTGAVGDVTERANINTSRSNKKNTIAAPIGCVTEAGAKDANCDGVDDAKPLSIDDRRKRTIRIEPRQQRR